jgi:hypothetical protein
MDENEFEPDARQSKDLKRQNMKFKLELIAADVDLKVQECSITYPHHNNARVFLRKLNVEEKSKAPVESEKDALCIVTVSLDPDSGVRRAFEASTTPTEGAMAASLNYSELPQHLQSFLESAQANCKAIAKKTLGAIRWYRNAIGQDLIRQVRAWECAIGTQVLKYFLVNVVTGIRVTLSESTDTTSIEAAAALVDANFTEPLAYDLLQEAEILSTKSPRSSLVIAIAAAEIGFKETVADLVPEASWLVENAPAPPLYRMLKEYLPCLPLRGYLKGHSIKIPDSILSVLRKGITLRNELVHTNPKEVPPQTLSEVLENVRWLLRILDACRGQDWALRYINGTALRAELSIIIGGFPQNNTIGRLPGPTVSVTNSNNPGDKN